MNPTTKPVTKFYMNIECMGRLTRNPYCGDTRFVAFTVGIYLRYKNGEEYKDAPKLYEEVMVFGSTNIALAQELSEGDIVEFCGSVNIRDRMDKRIGKEVPTRAIVIQSDNPKHYLKHEGATRATALTPEPTPVAKTRKPYTRKATKPASNPLPDDDISDIGDLLRA